MIRVITGAPCAGKSTYVNEHRSAGDIRIDFDLIAQALGAPDHGADGDIRQLAFVVRGKAIAWCMNNPTVDAWIIQSSVPDALMEEFKALDAEIIHVDTDLETCLERAEQDGRPQSDIDAIYSYFGKEKGENLNHRTKTAKDVPAFEGGTVTGYASTFVRTPDSYGDIIAKGAFVDTLERWAELNKQGVYIPLLYGHNTDDPKHNIGRVVEAKEDEYGLLVTAEFDAENDLAQYVRKLVKEGRVYQFSFAFDVQDWAEVELEDGRIANELRKLDLFEVSLVQIPANQSAVVVDVKAKGDEQARDLAREIAGVLADAANAVTALIEDSTDGGATENNEESKEESEDSTEPNVGELLDIIETIEKGTND